MLLLKRQAVVVVIGLVSCSFHAALMPSALKPWRLITSERQASGTLLRRITKAPACCPFCADRRYSITGIFLHGDCFAASLPLHSRVPLPVTTRDSEDVPEGRFVRRGGSAMGRKTKPDLLSSSVPMNRCAGRRQP